MKPIYPLILTILISLMVFFGLGIFEILCLRRWRNRIAVGTECYIIDFQNKKFSGKIIDTQRRKNCPYFFFRSNNNLCLGWIPAKNLFPINYKRKNA